MGLHNRYINNIMHSSPGAEPKVNHSESRYLIINLPEIIATQYVQGAIHNPGQWYSDVKNNCI